MKLSSISILLILLFLLANAFTPAPPSNANNLCAIFDEKPGWYRDAKKANEKWATPIPLLMSIIYQESSFKADAQPPRNKILGFIPTFRPSSSLGYTQAKDETWAWYKTKTGEPDADRDDFSAAADFVAWYVAQSKSRLGLSTHDTFSHYLAYHEGHKGFADQSFRDKKWLQKVASKVTKRANLYQSQLSRCQSSLDNRISWWSFF
ncbi:MAG: transglycosylase SLT domain-containing protein [Gammaproteobacteria bacterium]